MHPRAKSPPSLYSTDDHDLEEKKKSILLIISHNVISSGMLEQRTPALVSCKCYAFIFASFNQCSITILWFPETGGAQSFLFIVIYINETYMPTGRLAF